MGTKHWERIGREGLRNVRLKVGHTTASFQWWFYLSLWFGSRCFVSCGGNLCLFVALCGFWLWGSLWFISLCSFHHPRLHTVGCLWFVYLWLLYISFAITHSQFVSLCGCLRSHCSVFTFFWFVSFCLCSLSLCGCSASLCFISFWLLRHFRSLVTLYVSQFIQRTWSRGPWLCLTLVLPLMEMHHVLAYIWQNKENESFILWPTRSYSSLQLLPH